MSHRSSLDTVRAFFQMCDSLDFAAWKEIVADDVVVQFPFAPAGMPRRVEGSSNWEVIVRTFLSDTMAHFNWREVDLHSTDDPELVMGTAGSEASTKAGKSYCNRYCIVARARNGRLVEYSEYFDPVPVTITFGSLLQR